MSETATAVLPEYPEQFIAKTVKEKLTKSEVASVLSELQLNVSLGDLGDKAFSIVVTDESQKELMQEARTMRLAFVKERNRIDKVRKEIKEPYLRKTQVIDGTGRILKTMFEQAEAHLEKQEMFAIRKAEEQKRELKTKRVDALLQYVESNKIDPYLAGLTELSDVAFQGMLDSAKAAYEAKQVAIKEENERNIRERAELEAENKRLAEEKAESDRLAAVAKAAQDAAEQKQREAEAETARHKAEAEKKEQERIAAEEAETVRIADERAKAAAAPDKEKLLAYAAAVEAIEIPHVQPDWDDIGIGPNAEIIRQREMFLNEVRYIADKLRGVAVVDASCPF